jgi:hypothetical protein
VSRALAETLLSDFVLPLLRGGEVQIGRPIGWQGAQRILGVAASLARDGLEAQLAAACAQRLLALGALPPPLPSLTDDPEVLPWLVALHDLLFLARPEAQRLRPAVRDHVLREVLACAQPAALALDDRDRAQPPAATATLLHRHALLEPLFRLTRLDLRRTTWRDETLLRGLGRKQLAAAPSASAQAFTTLCWPELPLVVDGQGSAALQALLAGSPLTALWSPRPREATQHPTLAAELAQHAPLLRRPTLSRLLCHRYLHLGLPGVAAALSGPLLALLAQAVPDASLRPAAVTWLCLLSHLHWLAYIVLPQAPPAPELGEDAAPWFALFGCLHQLAPAWAQPPDVCGPAAGDPRLAGPAERSLPERARAHARRCRQLLPPSRLAELQRLLTQALATAAQ